MCKYSATLGSMERSSSYPFSTTECSRARVMESPVAKSVTSHPRATSPSVMLLATVSQAPYCRGGVRQATGDRIAILLLERIGRRLCIHARNISLRSCEKIAASRVGKRRRLSHIDAHRFAFCGAGAVACQPIVSQLLTVVARIRAAHLGKRFCRSAESYVLGTGE